MSKCSDSSGLKETIAHMGASSVCMQLAHPELANGLFAKALFGAIELLKIDWFPRKAGEKGEGTCPNLVQASGPEKITLINTIKALGARAREGTGDKEAAGMLLVTQLAIQLELCALARSKPELLRQGAEHSIAWVFPWSPFPGIKSWASTMMANLGIGKAVLAHSKSKGNLMIPANAVAFKLMAFMVFMRSGLIQHESSLRWKAECLRLGPLSELSLPDWWELGRRILPEMFPDLVAILYGGRQTARGDAIHRVRESYTKIWTLFVGIEKSREKGTEKESIK